MSENDKVKTMKERDPRKFQEWLDKNGCIVSTSHTSNIQFAYKDYYVTASNERRGSVAEINNDAVIYEIMANPFRSGEQEDEKIKVSLIAILKEKITNDLHVFNTLLKQLKTDQIIKEDMKITANEIIGRLAFLDSESA